MARLMATILRALLTAVLILYGWVAWTGAHAGQGTEALALHLRGGLFAALAAAAILSLPFAYFLGTGFWVRAFVRASRAGPEWEARHKLWMKARAYPWMYAAPFSAAGLAITGGLAETGRIAPLWHLLFFLAAALSALVALVLVPPVMRRNAALMDELADRHQVPRPGTPAMEALVAEERAVALPPLFQLSRVLMYGAVQLLIVWLYLRFGTEGWRDTPLWPFGAAFIALFTVGLGLNARFDPEHPRPARSAWGRALAVGAACVGVLAVLVRAGAG